MNLTIKPKPQNRWLTGRLLCINGFNKSPIALALCVSITWDIVELHFIYPNNTTKTITDRDLMESLHDDESLLVD